MKDMSEEKDKKKPTISDLEKLLENEPNAKVYIKPDGTIDVVNLTEQIKSLESRLKEANEMLQRQAKEMTRIKEVSGGWQLECQRLEDCNKNQFHQIESLSQRLSQAEAENKKLKQKEVDKKYCCENPLNSKHYGPCVEIDNATVVRQEKIIHDLQERLAEVEDCRNAFAKDHAEIDARLSHLMDVAGKMASVFEELKKEYQPQYHNYRWSLSRIESALASWQDFNNKQGENQNG